MVESRQTVVSYRLAERKIWSMLISNGDPKGHSCKQKQPSHWAIDGTLEAGGCIGISNEIIFT